jgi:hypothetical protein
MIIIARWKQIHSEYRFSGLTCQFGGTLCQSWPSLDNKNTQQCVNWTYHTPKWFLKTTRRLRNDHFRNYHHKHTWQNKTQRRKQKWRRMSQWTVINDLKNLFINCQASNDSGLSIAYWKNIQVASLRTAYRLINTTIEASLWFIATSLHQRLTHKAYRRPWRPVVRRFFWFYCVSKSCITTALAWWNMTAIQPHSIQCTIKANICVEKVDCQSRFNQLPTSTCQNCWGIKTVCNGITFYGPTCQN